ncbi:aspartyl/glutamyl-tRNA(Asn/Gln) amidotransferase subunit B [Edaphobacter modestus]|uniref:Aspartyl/glutamyl-tRNA(Asn/Gln) amidotransferase subunit B n=2 Tax=Edaphobacter modestus TaxID=388466 RepID=A0A4Q7YUZ2_9BACT|nr:aspartyl/glutamyl-tRNA(Asn/Gln) amidotransferase subunit B [Edaphobacter modestus]
MSGALFLTSFSAGHFSDFVFGGRTFLTSFWLVAFFLTSFLVVRTFSEGWAVERRLLPWSGGTRALGRIVLTMSTATALSPEILAKYQPVIGLEVHVQLLTESKAFCGCVNQYGGEPNTHTCPTCLGLPGALPVLNRRAVEYAVLAAKAINCEIRETSVFARKNYFYPDSPKGYQISQFDKPVAENGWIEVPALDGSGAPITKRIGVTRLHMEEDAGKSIHDGFADSINRTYIDLNRCGTPLVEIVSEPDLRTADEVFEYLTKLKEILLYTGVSDCNMEEGSLRCDANVSVMLKGAKQFGTKAEVKNVNSFRYIRAAVEYEIERQIGVLEDGGRVVQESRLWNSGEGRTYSMRSKEQAHDYRYFPEPDLPPLVVGAEWQAEILKMMPELPEARRERMIAEYGLNEQDAATITATRDFADRFETAAKKAKSAKRVASILLSEITMRLRAAELSDDQSPVSLDGIVAAADLMEAGTISSKQLKQLLDSSFAESKDFPEIYERDRPQQISDAGAIEKMIDEVIAANPKQVEQYRGGKKTVSAFFVGQVMKLSKGQANPGLLNELVVKKLDA